MKSFRLGFMLLTIVVWAADSIACSMHVNDNYVKNLLMTHGVSFIDLSLSEVTDLTVSSYSKSFQGADGGGDCPDYLIATGRVTMNHSPALNQNCNYEVTVTTRTYIGMDVPVGPFEDVTFEDAQAACSTSISSIKVPRKIRLKPRKQIIIRTF